MSRLSSQIEELHRKADELRLVHVDDTSVGILFAAMGSMREAADIIESLRDRLKTVRETSDGYHTFNELYHHRTVLFSVIVANHRDISWKSKLHHDGTMYEDMFIVGVDTPQGQATYHCDMEYWNIFWCKELERAPEWDGHTPDDAIERIGTLAAERTCKQVLSDCDDGLMPPFTAHCSACGDEWGFTPKYCPNCGRKVVNE